MEHDTTTAGLGREEGALQAGSREASALQHLVSAPEPLQVPSQVTRLPCACELLQSWREDTCGVPAECAQAGHSQAMVSSSRCFDITLGFWTALGNQLLLPRLGKCCTLQRPGGNLAPRRT